MRIVLHSRALYILGAFILIGIALFLLIRTFNPSTEERITTTISRGDIEQIVSVSGVIESNTTADLSFPVSDIVTQVNVQMGDEVTKGDILAILRQTGLQARRQTSVATFQIAKADRDELLTGPRNEARDISNTAAINAEANLLRTIEDQRAKVAHAYRTLLSNDLEAVPDNSNNNDTPPAISGAYICEEEGNYTLDTYSSSARSGYSYRLSGLESGTYTAFSESAGIMGYCGLAIQFADGESYANSNWIIEVPNTRSSTYATYLNAYELALVTRLNAVESAEEALDNALKNEALDNASPREEALKRANAEVLRASAGIELIDAQITERTLRAPFDGTITNVDIVVGETVTGPIITLAGDNTFDLSARIPEIDIAKIAILNIAEVTFDARANEVVTAEISFISPLATEIDGVAYFEARLTFPEKPTWLRAGLNADIEIVVAQQNNVLRLPKRFVTEENGIYSVLVIRTDNLELTPVTIGFVGNDGFIEIIGLTEGDTVAAP